MKQLNFILTISLTLFACNQPAGNMKVLQNRIDSLENKLARTYKPGFGEFMSNIQVHHAKLWFAGQNQNWKLADFEINEIKESLTGIQQYCTDRPESKSIGMIDHPMDSMSNAIRQKDPILFKTGFMLLTATCNNCHKETNHEFNVIKIPDNPPFTNQEFKVNNFQ
ncbi:MAG: hypothetical protein ABI760_21000 [Ferruginibacter sp.]